MGRNFSWSKILYSKELPIALSVLIILGTGSWYVWHRAQTQKAEEKAASVLPPGWIEYKNPTYGFKIFYPKNWGPINAYENPQQHGKAYTISLAVAQPASSKYEDIFAINFDSADVSNKRCDPNDPKQCVTTSAFTRADINKALSAGKKGFIKSDNSSFASYKTGVGFSILDVYQIVDLPQIQATAAHATYQRFSAGQTCPQNKLVANPKVGCIGEPLYNDIHRILKSLKSL